MQQPAPGVNFAGNGARFVAWIVDGVVLSVITGVIVAVLAVVVLAGAASDSNVLAGLGIIGGVLLVMVLSIAYLPWFWAHGGQTPGMKMLRLRVVRDRDGGPVGGGQAILRLVGYWVSGAFMYLGFIWILFDARRQGWHDKIAGTVVIEVH
jgi:uncharacterized RDD family membrane protein YckC